MQANFVQSSQNAQEETTSILTAKITIQVSVPMEENGKFNQLKVFRIRSGNKSGWDFCLRGSNFSGTSGIY